MDNLGRLGLATCFAALCVSGAYPAEDPVVNDLKELSGKVVGYVGVDGRPHLQNVIRGLTARTLTCPNSVGKCVFTVRLTKTPVYGVDPVTRKPVQIADCLVQWDFDSLSFQKNIRDIRTEITILPESGTDFPFYDIRDDFITFRMGTVPDPALDITKASLTSYAGSKWVLKFVSKNSRHKEFYFDFVAAKQGGMGCAAHDPVVINGG